MRTSEATIGGSANFGPRHLAGEGQPIGGRFCIALQRYRAVHPRNTAENLSADSGYSLSNAERVLAGRRGMNAERALDLITSGEAGARVLEAYIESLPEERRLEAWAALRRAARRAELSKRLATQRAELDELESVAIKPSKSRR